MNNTTNQAQILSDAVNATNNAVVLKDMKPPVPIPATWEWLLWILAGILVVALVYYFWKKWAQNKEEALQVQRRIPPHIKARQKLLHAEDIIENPEPFCIAVSEAIRTYLAERFELHAPDRTTEEFLNELQSNSVLQVEHKEILGEFLELCDLVKFAKFEPQIPKLKQLLSVANRLIDETEPGLENQDEGPSIKQPQGESRDIEKKGEGTAV